MHELSLSSAILDTAVRHADGRKVNSIEITAGALRQVVMSSLRFYFEIVSRDTICEGARLELNEVEARVSCNDCDAPAWTLDQPIFRCGACGGSDVEVLSGSEFMVESIDVEDREGVAS